MKALAARPRLWYLNFDAEDELAGEAPAGPALTERALPWVGPGDSVLRAGETPLKADRARVALEAVAWCPTPSAIEALRAAGASALPHALEVDVLRAANARETFADLHPLNGLGALVARSSAQVKAAVDRSAPTRPSGRGPAWLLRRSLSAAGQGRLLVEAWSSEVESWVQRALARGPVHVLPMVDVLLEFSLHAFLMRNGSVLRGRPVVQSVHGASWRSSRPWTDADGAQLGVDARSGLLAGEQARSEICARLLALGYRGPVGIDGFAWRDDSGRSHAGWGTDVNARYTMSMGSAFDIVPSESEARPSGGR